MGEVRYRLDEEAKRISYPAFEIRTISWEDELPMIRRFYAYWGADDIEPPTEEEAMGKIVAIVREGEILSMCAPFSFREGEIEIGAVFTLPEYQGKGYCRRVISELARQVLAKGMVATLTTADTNRAMQKAAESIGMMRVR